MSFGLSRVLSDVQALQVNNEAVRGYCTHVLPDTFYMRWQLVHLNRAATHLLAFGRRHISLLGGEEPGTPCAVVGRSGYPANCPDTW